MTFRDIRDHKVTESDVWQESDAKGPGTVSWQESGKKVTKSDEMAQLCASIMTKSDINDRLATLRVTLAEKLL